MDADPRDEVCPECGKTVREHIEEVKAFEKKMLVRTDERKRTRATQDEIREALERLKRA
jgi:hypothetical protein